MIYAWIYARMHTHSQRSGYHKEREVTELKSDLKEVHNKLEDEARKNGKLSEEISQIQSTEKLKIDNAVNKAKMQALFFFMQQRFTSPSSTSTAGSSSCETPQVQQVMPQFFGGMDGGMTSFFSGAD